MVSIVQKMYDMTTLDEVRCYVEKNPDSIHTLTDLNESIMIAACHLENVAIVHYLWERGVSIHTPNVYGETPLHIASKYEYLDTIDFLLSKNANINAQTTHFKTPLLCAIQANNHSVAKFLLAKGSDTSLSDNLSYTPLMYIIYNGDTDLAIHFIRQGACIRGDIKNKVSPLTLSVAYHMFEVASVLLKCGQKDHPSLTAKAFYILVNHYNPDSFQLIQYMLDHVMNPNYRWKRHHTPLLEACRKSSVRLVELLLSKGARANARSCNNDTALLWAARTNQLASVRLLLLHGANPNLRNNTLENPLMACIVECHEYVFEELVYRCNLSIRTGALRRTFLMHAAVHGTFRMAEKLLYRAPHTLLETDMDGHTARDLACIHEKEELTFFLLHAEQVHETTTMDNLEVYLPIPLWKRLLPSLGQRALYTAVTSYKIDHLACYYALFLHEDELRKRHRQGECVYFSQAPLRKLTRAMGNRPIRIRILTYLIFPKQSRDVFARMSKSEEGR